ncbi:hypothetical protein Dalk_0271 [Desulfatibacillum aliphaticivorans]|uniref:Uncharacterized protein n=1 Tax=Desulfatibacillum aliphaticivorans TaxID=218208 RepID=B8F8U8_DESAL|nr:hypothetical protein Dalk_0271 [Desulfatibacillum aliphaticivorans]
MDVSGELISLLVLFIFFTFLRLFSLFFIQLSYPDEKERDTMGKLVWNRAILFAVLGLAGHYVFFRFFQPESRQLVLFDAGVALAGAIITLIKDKIDVRGMILVSGLAYVHIRMALFALDIYGRIRPFP